MGEPLTIRGYEQGEAIAPTVGMRRNAVYTPAEPLKWQDIDGWLFDLEATVLQTFAAGKDVLELGSYKGKSTVCMAQTARLVVSVDPHQGDRGLGPADTFAEFRANIEAAGVL